MKVYVYKKNFKNRKREKVIVLKDVEKVIEEMDLIIVVKDGTKLPFVKKEFMMSIFTYWKEITLKVDFLGEFFDIKVVENVKEIKETEKEILLITDKETIHCDKEVYKIRLSYY